MTSYTALTREVYNKWGLMGFYRGFWAMFWRDVPWYGVFFYSYDVLCKRWIKENDSFIVADLKRSMACGIAGIMNWLPSYPADVIKSV